MSLSRCGPTLLVAARLSLPACLYPSLTGRQADRPTMTCLPGDGLEHMLLLAMAMPPGSTGHLIAGWGRMRGTLMPYMIMRAQTSSLPSPHDGREQEHPNKHRPIISHSLVTDKTSIKIPSKSKTQTQAGFHAGGMSKAPRAPHGHS